MLQSYSYGCIKFYKPTKISLGPHLVIALCPSWMVNPLFFILEKPGMLSPAKNQALETQVEIGLRKEPPCGKEIDLYSNHGGPDSYSLYIYIYICIYMYIYMYIVNAPGISHHVHVHVISLILADHHCAVRSPSFLWPFDRTHWGGGWERLLELRKSYEHWVLCWGRSCGRFNRVDHIGNRVFPVHSQYIYICIYIYMYICIYIYGGFLKWNGATPKSCILIGFSIINHPFWVPPFMEPPYIVIFTCLIYINILYIQYMYWSKPGTLVKPIFLLGHGFLFTSNIGFQRCDPSP